jgi:DNA polymerase I-like protein with 3'-5' exonuclease and polymerase domains
MLQCYEAGHTPMLTVHDELCFSIKDEASVTEIVDIMENCVPEMKIPSRVDYGLSKNWGLAK